MKDEFILGIDLGTTNSCASVVLDGQPFIISNEDGETIVPSVVVLKNDQMIVGNDAKNLLLEDNVEVIYSIKRLMGSKEKIKIGNMQYTPEQISSMILLYIKNRCEMALNTKIKKAVITVPAYFHDGQRQATINAGKIAGIDVLRIINEPTAAAIAYGFQKEGAKNKNILVYDLGGGTFDVSILKITKDFFEVLSTSGDNFLGGDDWDKRIFDWIIEEIKKQYNIDLDVNNVNIVNKLKSYSEFIKKALSNADEVNIDFEPITNLKDCTKVFSKAEFEYRTKDLMERTKKPVEDAIKESKLTIDEIDMAVLVGGSTRMPIIYDYVYNLFNGRVANDINPDEVVALGAAIQGAILKGEVNIQVQDVTPLTLGLETYDGLTVPILPRNSKIPTTVKQIFTTNFDNQTKIDINIVQGERKFAKDNRLLSNFEFTDIPLAKQGEPSIEISYIIDANGVLSVQAKDLDTNKQTKVIVKDNSGLSSKDISKMISEAQRLKEQDIKKLDDIRIYQIAYEYLNILIEYVNTELNDIIPFYNRERSLKWIADFSKWIEEKDYDALRKKLFAFQLHVNISLHPRIKQGQDKIGFKN